MTSKAPKSIEDMTPDEREEVNLLQIRALIEETKSGVLRRGKVPPPKAKPARAGDPAEETVGD
jgi:hypothetical protein